MSCPPHPPFTLLLGLHWTRRLKPRLWSTLASAPLSPSPVQSWMRAASSQRLRSQEGWERLGPSHVFWTKAPSAF